MLPDPAKNAFHDQKRLLAGVPVRTIFDLGAFVGDITAIYADLFPEATIYAFEPFPENFYALKGRFIGSPRLKPVRSAVANQLGTRQFHVNRDSATNSLLPTAPAAADWVTPASAVETVSVLEAPVTTIDDFCRQEGIEEIHILKMDIQGGELLALEGAQENLRRGSIALVYAEVEFVPIYEGQAYFHEVATWLGCYGYTLFDLYNFVYAENGQAKWGDALFVSPQIRASQSAEWAVNLREAAGTVKPNNVSCASLEELQGELAANRRERERLEARLQAVENSAGWRLLHRWRRWRDRLAPEGTRRRWLYDSVVKPLRRSG